jgi:hypothetical protein
MGTMTQTLFVQTVTWMINALEKNSLPELDEWLMLGLEEQISILYYINKVMKK